MLRLKITHHHLLNIKNSTRCYVVTKKFSWSHRQSLTFVCGNVFELDSFQVVRSQCRNGGNPHTV